MHDRWPPRPAGGHAPARHRERPHADAVLPSCADTTRSRRARRPLPGVPAPLSRARRSTRSKMRPSSSTGQPPSRAPPYGSKPRWAAADVAPPAPTLHVARQGRGGAGAGVAGGALGRARSPSRPAALRRHRPRHQRRQRRRRRLARLGERRHAPVRRSAAVGAAISAAADDDAGAAATRGRRHAAQTERPPGGAGGRAVGAPPPPGTPPTPDGHVADAEDDDYADDDYDDDDDAAAAPPAPATGAATAVAAAGAAALAVGTCRLRLWRRRRRGWRTSIAAAQPLRPRRARSGGWSGGAGAASDRVAVVRAACAVPPRPPRLRAPAQAVPVRPRRRLDARGSMAWRPPPRRPLECATTCASGGGDGAVCRPRYRPAARRSPTGRCAGQPCRPPRPAGTRARRRVVGARRASAWTTASMGGPVRFQM